MKVAKRIDYHGHSAVLFQNGDVAWAGQLFPAGAGANLGLLVALGVA